MDATTSADNDSPGVSDAEDHCAFDAVAALDLGQLDYRPDTARLRTDPKYSGFDNNVGDSWIYPTNYPVRRYQYDITHAALFRNTLVVLPTGLGKTFLAAVVMYNMYRWYPCGRVVFMAPTRPLVAQQIEACYQIMGIPRSDTCELTGRQAKEQRLAAWRSKRVFFVTPQVLAIDMRDPGFPLAQVRLLVVDEAHKARGRYAYTDVVSWLHERNQCMRVLALSATPGRSVDDVAQVVRNLRISALAVRGEQSADVLPYTHAKCIRSVVVRLGAALSAVRGQLLQIIEPYVQNLLALDVLAGNVATLSKGWLVMQQKRFVEASQQQRHPQHAAAMADFGTCISLYHALELLERHGVRIFLRFFDDADKFYLRRDPQLSGLLADLRNELGDVNGGVGEPLPVNFDFGHPKYEILRVSLLQHFEAAEATRAQANNDIGEANTTRALIFCEYKESVFLIERLLAAEQLLRPRIFVGQGSVTQRQQLATMADFRAGRVNVLIATCVAEEGIDVGEIDLIVCFDISNRNPTRFVQRIGRTGRKRDGQVLMLVTEGREQKLLADVLASRDVTNERLADSAALQAVMVPSPRMVPTEFNPKCIETFIKIMGVQPLTKEGEETTSGFEDGVQRTEKQKGRKPRVQSKIKGVQDVRQFFKPVNAATLESITMNSSVAGTTNVDRPQKSIVYEDSFLDPDVVPYVSSSPDTPLASPQPTNMPFSPRGLQYVRILQNLKNLPKIKRDLVGPLAVSSKPVLTTKIVLKRSHKVPKSLHEFTVAQSMSGALVSASTVPDQFDYLFDDLRLDEKRFALQSLQMTVLPNENTELDDTTATEENIFDENVDGPALVKTQFITQLPLFIDNESRYPSYMQSPFPPVVSELSMMSSTPIRRSDKTSAMTSLEKNRNSKRIGGPVKTPNKLTPIRDAFQRVLQMRSMATTAQTKPQLQELLAFFRLRNILDIFQDDEANESTKNIPLNLTKLSKIFAETDDHEKLKKHEISDLFQESFRPDETIEISSGERSKSSSQEKPAKHEQSTCNGKHISTMKAIDLGTFDDVFGSDDDMFASILRPSSEYVAPPCRSGSPAGTLSVSSSDDVIPSTQNIEQIGPPLVGPSRSSLENSSDEVIQSSQHADHSVVVSNPSGTKRPSFASKLAQRRMAILAGGSEDVVTGPTRQISVDMFEVTSKSTGAAASAVRDVRSLGQSSSQKENDAPKWPQSIVRKSSESPTRPVGNHPSGLDVSPSVINFGRLLRRKPDLTENAVPVLASVESVGKTWIEFLPNFFKYYIDICFADLTPFEHHVNVSHNLSVIGVRRRFGSNARRVLQSSDDDADDDFERIGNQKSPVSPAIVRNIPERQPSKPHPPRSHRRRPRCDFVADECAVSEDEECSSDEEETGVSAMLDSLICDEDERPVSTSMRALYLQSVRYK